MWHTLLSVCGIGSTNTEYGSEIWGRREYHPIERTVLKYCFTASATTSTAVFSTTRQMLEASWGEPERVAGP